jgi:hypothetical protein
MAAIKTSLVDTRGSAAVGAPVSSALCEQASDNDLSAAFGRGMCVLPVALDD